MSRLVRCAAGAALAAALLLSSTGCATLTSLSGGASTATSTDVNQIASFPPLADAGLKSCGMAGPLATASGTLTNPTKNPYHYLLQVTFSAKNGKTLDVAFAHQLPVLKGGATLAWTATGQNQITGPVTCGISEVARQSP
jgi:hypothetical protein